MMNFIDYVDSTFVNICDYVSNYGSYVYGSCTVKHDHYTSLSSVSAIVKLTRQFGTLVFIRYPMLGPINQINDKMFMFEGLSATRDFVSYRYSESTTY
jgi:hypothetical protein